MTNLDPAASPLEPVVDPVLVARIVQRVVPIEAAVAGPDVVPNLVRGVRYERISTGHQLDLMDAITILFGVVQSVLAVMALRQSSGAKPSVDQVKVLLLGREDLAHVLREIPGLLENVVGALREEDLVQDPSTPSTPGRPGSREADAHATEPAGNG